MNYWLECIHEAFCDAGITATQQQIEEVADTVRGAHENYGMAHGHDCIPNPLRIENERLHRELRQEQAKRVCPECKGRGCIVIDGPVHSSISQCDKCRGDGKV